MRPAISPVAQSLSPRSRGRRATHLFLAAALSAALAGAGTLGPGESIVPSSQPARFNKGAPVIVDLGFFGDVPAVFVGHYFESPTGDRIAIVYNDELGEGEVPMDWLRPAAATSGASTGQAAPATANGSSDALSAEALPNGKTVVVGWARGASNGFGASGFVSLVRSNLTPDPSFNGTGFALVKVGATTFFNDVVVTPHGIIAAGFGTNEAGADSRLLFARFGLNGQKTGQLAVNVGPATDQVAELAYNRLRDIVYFVGSTAQADTFADGLVGVLNPKTMKLVTSFGGGDGMAQVNNPSGHAFFTSAELVANGLAACGVFGSQGMCHSFNYLGQTGALWGPNGCLRSGAVFSRCDTDIDGNVYCAALGGAGTCSVCKIDPGCTGASFGTNGCQPWFAGYVGACAPRAVVVAEPSQPKGFTATDPLIAQQGLTPNPSGLGVAFNDLVAVGQVLVGNLSQAAYKVMPAFTPDKSPCAPGSLCLSGNRFQVTAFNTSGGPISPANGVPITADTGYFTFANPNNVEIVTKVVNACGLGSRFWVFAAGLTNQGVGIRVRDTKTGVIKEYINPINRPFPPLQDTAAFATCPIVAGDGYEPILSFEDEGAAAEPDSEVAMQPPTEPSLEVALAEISDHESAVLAAELERLDAAGVDELADLAVLRHLGAPINLRAGRFKVEATFKTPTGPTTPATGVLITDETAYFRFLNPANVEVIVKIVNACGFGTPRYWVFAAGLTNVRVDITVTDTLRGNKKVYTNNQGVPFKPIQDTNGFATCP